MAVCELLDIWLFLCVVTCVEKNLAGQGKKDKAYNMFSPQWGNWTETKIGTFHCGSKNGLKISSPVGILLNANNTFLWYCYILNVYPMVKNKNKESFFILFKDTRFNLSTYVILLCVVFKGIQSLRTLE